MTLLHKQEVIWKMLKKLYCLKNLNKLVHFQALHQAGSLQEPYLYMKN